MRSDRKNGLQSDQSISDNKLRFGTNRVFEIRKKTYINFFRDALLGDIVYTSLILTSVVLIFYKKWVLSLEISSKPPPPIRPHNF